MAEASEMACVYAALVLHDDDIPITEDKIKTLIKAAGVEVAPYWPSMFAKLLQNVNIEDLISNIGAAPAAGAGGGAAAGGDAPAEEAKEEVKEESEEEEEEEEMDFDLFD